MNRSLVFTPGCDWKIDRRILFVEYETVTGKPMSKRFDLSAETEYIADGYKMLSFDEISKPESKLQYSIQKIVYFEKECNSMVAFSRGCRQTRLFIPTRIEFDTIIHVPKESPNVDSDRVKMINQRIARDTLNSAYGIASRDWGDVLAESARYIHMQRSRCSGKTMWLSSATSFADEQPLRNIASCHDVCEQWLKQPPEPVQFISDDLEDREKGVPNTKLIDPNRLYFQDTTTGEMKPFEGVKSITPKPMHFRGRTWTHPESTYGERGHMLVVDSTSRQFFRDDEYLDVEVGDVMLYDDGNNGKADPDYHGKLFVWQGLGIGWKKLSDNNGYLDTDTVTEKIFKEEMKMAEKTRFDMYKPKISKVIFNDPATIVFWTDGTKTIVKCGENDDFDPEKGIAMACMKKLLGTNKTGSNYLDGNGVLLGVKKYIQKWEEDNPVENIWTKLFCELGKMTGEDLVNTDAMDIPEETENSETTEGGENNDEA